MFLILKVDGLSRLIVRVMPDGGVFGIGHADFNGGSARSPKRGFPLLVGATDVTLRGVSSRGIARITLTTMVYFLYASGAGAI